MPPQIRAFLSCRDPSSDGVQDLSVIISAASNHNGGVVRVMARASPPETNVPALHQQCLCEQGRRAASTRPRQVPVLSAATSFPPSNKSCIKAGSGRANMSFKKPLWLLFFPHLHLLFLYLSLERFTDSLDKQEGRARGGCFCSSQERPPDPLTAVPAVCFASVMRRMDRFYRRVSEEMNSLSVLPIPPGSWSPPEPPGI